MKPLDKAVVFFIIVSVPEYLGVKVAFWTLNHLLLCSVDVICKQEKKDNVMKLSQILPLVVGGAVAGIVVSAASPAQALEFVTNGNFESGGTGWTGPWNFGNFGVGGNSSSTAFTTAFENSPANLSQTISGLSVGQTYNFSFDYFQYSSGTVLTPNGIIATLGFSIFSAPILASLIDTTPSSFTNFSTTFVATTTTSLLNFRGYSDPGSAWIDNVSLTDGVSVPFDIPGGATIPTVGSLFVLGLMRQAKKRLALKSQVVSRVETVAS